MTLASGSRLGSYEVLSALGAGGMGEVYRAHDTKLGRDVAIKLLPDTFAHDSERVARFKREAHILASLNHPHIAGIHGLEEAEGSAFLVLELVDGQSLAERLAAGALPISEAMAFGRQIVDALETAHEKGIIHRDLKPANIMLNVDGQVKVLDFGLAKAEGGDAGGKAVGLTHSPTLSLAATQAGMILGTAAYMSPEQAKGRPADKRSDVWAFGCVLYEMLTGNRAFDGEDVSDTLAAILRAEPDWTKFSTEVPPHIRSIVKRCLEKDRKARIPDMSVVRFMMVEAIGTPAATPATAPASNRKPALVWKAATALLVITIIIAAVVAYVARSATPAVVRFLISPPDKGAFSSGGIGAVARISPDGRMLAFTARDAAGKTSVWIRAIDSLTAQPLAGTDGASWPFWSPDSRQIAYFAAGKLMKIAASGGPPQTLCTLGGSTFAGRGGAWNRDGVIVFNNGPGPLFRVSSAGGQASPALPLATGQLGQSFPSFLPDGRHVLFYADAPSTEVSGIYVVSLDSGESKRLLAADSGGLYARESGYLLFVRQGTLLAQSLDPKSLTLADEPFPVAERVDSRRPPGMVAFSISEDGVLAYGTGSNAAIGLQMVWVDRQGKPIETVGPEGNYRGLDLSPDGKRIAAHRHDGTGGDIWISEPSPGPTSRFTFDASQENSSPIWSPDGSRIVFGSLRSGKWGLYAKASNQAGNEEQLVQSDLVALPVSWAPDGGSIVYVVSDPKTQTDLWVLPLSGDRKAIPLLQTAFRESHGQISPNGKWLAHNSDETGRGEIYVRSFPAGSGKWQVSTNGGQFPRWRRDGSELFYMSAASGGKLVAVDVKPDGAAFEHGTPHELFDSEYINLIHSSATAGTYHTFSVSADGQRFLIPRPPETDATTAGSTPIVVVLNWEVGLKK